MFVFLRDSYRYILHRYTKREHESRRDYNGLPARALRLGRGRATRRGPRFLVQYCIVRWGMFEVSESTKSRIATNTTFLCFCDDLGLSMASPHSSVCTKNNVSSLCIEVLHRDKFTLLHPPFPPRPPPRATAVVDVSSSNAAVPQQQFAHTRREPQAAPTLPPPATGKETRVLVIVIPPTCGIPIAGPRDHAAPPRP